jgi:hypothetical protein
MTLVLRITLICKYGNGYMCGLSQIGIEMKMNGMKLFHCNNRMEEGKLTKILILLGQYKSNSILFLCCESWLM